MATTAQDICFDALIEIGNADPGDLISPDDLTAVLNKLNRLLDNWNADERAVYATSFVTYTIITSHTPLTIGPTGDYVVTQRPVRIDGANLVYTNVTPIVKIPLNIRDDQWWLANQTPTISTTTPTDLYYNAGWPNGQMYLWPQPTVAYGLELLTVIVLGQLALSDAFSLPPGYRDAITLTLAEDICSLFDQIPAQSLVKSAALARARVFANNDQVMRLTTADWGMPSGANSGTRADFNYLTGAITSGRRGNRAY